MAERIVTPVFRIAFPELFTPVSFNGGKEKYSLKMLFRKDKYPDRRQIEPLYAAVSACAREQWPGKIPSDLKPTFRDGDAVPNWDGFPGNWFVAAWTLQKPVVVDSALVPVVRSDAVYGGMYARAQVEPFAYDQLGNRGVGFMLYMIQIVRDGERLGGGGSADAGSVFGKSEGGWTQTANTPAEWSSPAASEAPDPFGGTGGDDIPF